MHIRMRTVLSSLAALALAVALPVGPTRASANHDQGGHLTNAAKVFTLDPSIPGNNPEGVAWDPASQSFFVGTVATGAIHRGTLRDARLRPFITPDAAAPADSAVGMKVAGGRLYVAGGATGSIYVYNVKTGALLARFEAGPGGFLNDLVVTPTGDVFVTDSFRPVLWHLTPAMVRAGSGAPDGINVGPEIAYTPGQFNLNGIVARPSGRELIVVNSFSKSLFRIDIDRDNPAARKITRIDAPELAGDGLLIDQNRLLVVTGNPAAVTVLNLARLDLVARADRVLTDPSLRGPSTIARAGNRYLVVNADFATNTQPYTVSALLRAPGVAHLGGRGGADR